MKNNRGAASILVILIIVVLATFGGIALTAGYTNKQLAIKAAQSKADYYMLDGAGEAIVATVDSLLYDAARESTVYLNSLMALDDKDTIKKDIRLEALFSHDNTQVESHALQVKKLSDIYDRIYFYNSAKALSTYAKQNQMALIYTANYAKPEDFLNASNAAPVNGDLVLAFIIGMGDAPGQKSLDIALSVQTPENIITINDNVCWQTDFDIAQSIRTIRYRVMSWKLKQNPIGDKEDRPKFG